MYHPRQHPQPQSTMAITVNANMMRVRFISLLRLLKRLLGQKGQPVAAASGRDASDVAGLVGTRPRRVRCCGSGRDASTTRPQSAASRSRTARGAVPTSPLRTFRGNVPTTCTVTISLAKKNDSFLPIAACSLPYPPNGSQAWSKKRSENWASKITKPAQCHSSGYSQIGG